MTSIQNIIKVKQLVRRQEECRIDAKNNEKDAILKRVTTLALA